VGVLHLDGERGGAVVVDVVVKEVVICGLEIMLKTFFFSLSLMQEAEIAKAFCPRMFFQPSLIFASKAAACPGGAPLRRTSLERATDLSVKY
jgi:hypothetical protein